MNNALMFSSATDVCSTPQDFFDKLNEDFVFELDVCANEDNAKCRQFFTKEQDGLSMAWSVYAQRIWMNPPYGREIRKWVKKAHEESKEGSTVVCLLPARTDTRWWHDYIWDESTDDWRDGVQAKFVKGRLKFGGLKNAAPFPSAVIIFWGVVK